MQSIQCLSCRGTDCRFCKSLDGTDVYGCANCGLQFCFPLPDIASASAGEGTVLTEESYTEEAIQSFAIREEAFRELAKNRISYFNCVLGVKKFRILEVGCGVAALGGFYAQAGLYYHGIDIDRRMISAAKKRGINADEQDLFQIPDGEKYDIITFSQVLEHIKSPTEFLFKIRTLLAPDGIVICDIPNTNALSGRIAALIGNRKRWNGIEIPHHSIAYNSKALSALFANHFNSVEVFSVTPNHPLWGQARLSTQLEKTYFLLSSILHSKSILVAIARNPRSC